MIFHRHRQHRQCAVSVPVEGVTLTDLENKAIREARARFGPGALLTVTEYNHVRQCGPGFQAQAVVAARMYPQAHRQGRAA